MLSVKTYTLAGFEPGSSVPEVVVMSVPHHRAFALNLDKRDLHTVLFQYRICMYMYVGTLFCY
jgi:hypothetical protein